MTGQQAGRRTARRPDPVAMATAALGSPVCAASIVARVPITYDPYLAGRVVERAHGSAILADGRKATWTAVIKTTEGAGLRAARRELAVYRQALVGTVEGDAVRHLVGVSRHILDAGDVDA